MGYYAAGGYYNAGGFSFKKLTKFVAKAAHNPIVQALGGFIPGVGTALAGINAVGDLTAGMGHGRGAHATVGGSAGTPGHNARASQRGLRPRRRGRRYR